MKLISLARQLLHNLKSTLEHGRQPSDFPPREKSVILRSILSTEDRGSSWPTSSLVHLSYSKTISRDVRSNPFTMHYQGKSTVQSRRRRLPYRLYQLSSKLRSIVRCWPLPRDVSSPPPRTTPRGFEFPRSIIPVQHSNTGDPCPCCLASSNSSVHQACTILFRLDGIIQRRQTS